MTKRSLTTAPTRENELFIPLEILSHIFNSVPLDDISSRSALLRCGPVFHKILQPSLATTIDWINANVIDRYGHFSYYDVVTTYQQTRSPFLAIIAVFLVDSTFSTCNAFENAFCRATVTNYDRCLRLFCCLDYIVTLYTTTYRLNLATGKSFKFCEAGNRPSPGTRLRDIWVRCDGITARPLLEEDIRIVSDMPKTQKKQIGAILDSIEEEPDERMAELLKSYYNAGGNADATRLRAKCFLITRDERTLRMATDKDCLEDVVLLRSGGFMHIHSPPVRSFLNDCFVYTGVEDTGQQATLFARNEAQNAETLLLRLQQITHVCCK